MDQSNFYIANRSVEEFSWKRRENHIRRLSKNRSTSD